MHSLDGSDGALGDGRVLRGLGDGAGARVAVGVHPKLGVGVDVEVEGDTFAGGDAVELRLEGLVLDGVTGRSALVVLGAGGGGGAGGLRPVGGPVAVDVAADAAGRRRRLPVLAPQAVRALRVCEAVRVDNGEDVEVELVLERLVGGDRGCEELVSCVLDHHGGDPLARVHCTVPDDTLLRTLASAAPDVDTGDVATLQRLASRDDFGVAGECGSEIFHPLRVLRDGVVGVEPCRTRWRGGGQCWWNLLVLCLLVCPAQV